MIICPKCEKPIECLNGLPGLKINSDIQIKCDQCNELVTIKKGSK